MQAALDKDAGAVFLYWPRAVRAKYSVQPNKGGSSMGLRTWMWAVMGTAIGGLVLLGLPLTIQILVQLVAR
jgi:hypothetical protein